MKKQGQWHWNTDTEQICNEQKEREYHQAWKWCLASCFCVFSHLQPYHPPPVFSVFFSVNFNMVVSQKNGCQHYPLWEWSLFNFQLLCMFYNIHYFPGGSDGKAFACNAGDPGSIPGSRRFPGEGNGNPLQYSCLENLMDREAWWATFHGVTKSRTQLSD